MLEIESVNQDSYRNLPVPCRYCLYWQTTGDYGEEMLNPEKEKEKREWFNKVTKEFGSCMKTAYSDGVPVGFMQYAPAKFFPRVKEYTSEQPHEDAIFIACLYITDKGARGKGFGTDMLKDFVAGPDKRGAKAVETFARRNSAENPSGPLKLYLKHGFKTKDEKSDFPLIRLEL